MVMNRMYRRRYRRKRGISKFITPQIVRYTHVVNGNLGMCQTPGNELGQFTMLIPTKGEPSVIPNNTYKLRTFIDHYDHPKAGYMPDDENLKRLLQVYERYKLCSVFHVLSNFRLKKINFVYKDVQEVVSLIEKNYAVFKYLQHYDTGVSDYADVSVREIDPKKITVTEEKLDYLPIQYFYDHSGTIYSTNPAYDDVDFVAGDGYNYRRKIIGAHSKLKCRFKLQAIKFRPTTDFGQTSSFMQWLRILESNTVPPVLKARIHVSGNEEFDNPLRDTGVEMYVVQCDYKVYYNMVFAGRNPRYMYIP